MRDVMTRFFVALILLLFCGSLFAYSSDEIFKKGNISYENEDYEKAVSSYEMLIKMDRVSPEVFYNLGNSYFKLKRLGKTIVNYERALVLSPRDRDIISNLKLARTKTLDKIETPDRGFIMSVLLFLYDRMNINELTILSSIIYLFIIILSIFSVFLVTKRRTFFYIIAVSGMVFIVCAIFLAVKIYDQHLIKKAIVVVEKVDVRSGPKDDYLGQFSLHEGTKLRVVEEREDWYEIELSDDLRGWVPKDSIELI